MKKNERVTHELEENVAAGVAAARERRPPDDHGEDRVELDPQARVVGVGRVDVGADHEAGHAGAQAREDVDGPEDAL